MKNDIHLLQIRRTFVSGASGEEQLKVLIYGIYPDTHTESVAWGLRKKGVHVDVWHQGNFPYQQEISVNFNCDAQETSLDIRDFSFHVESFDYDVIWYRRPSNPTLHEITHKADQEMAFREASAQLTGIGNLFRSESAWINEPQANRKASDKIYQLKTAMECDLSFPPTLFSNSPSEIRDFAKKHGQIIYKPFLQSHWQIGERRLSLFTTKIRAEQLNNDAALRLCPGIFQRLVEKDYEIRLTIMGDNMIPVKIYDYPNELAALDWRSAAVNGVKYELTTLPKHIIEKSRNLMKKLGISFACLDFIVDKVGNYHFLEVNPSGQFLWLEDRLPSVPVLNQFCDFLISSATSAWKSDTTVNLAEFDDFNQTTKEFKKSIQEHKIYANPFFLFRRVALQEYLCNYYSYRSENVYL